MARTKSVSKAKSRRATPKPPDSLEVDIHLIKANNFRVIHADGVWGGPSANAIHMTVFSERRALPRRVKYSSTPDGTPIELEREGLTGFVRELEADIVMSVTTAVAIRAWLDERIKEMEAITAQVAAQINPKGTNP